MRPTFDERDAAILAERIAQREARPGPRVGDFCIMPTGELLRFTLNWHELGLQTTYRSIHPEGTPGYWDFAASESFYFQDGGTLSYSGSLDDRVPLHRIEDTTERREGSAWFFHHDEMRGHNGVYVTVPCRVYRILPAPAEAEAA
jgi:hypothetical protein